MHPQITQISQRNKTLKPHDDTKTYAIIGAAQEVHKQLGSGFLEAVYERALSVEFALRDIKFEEQVALPVIYKGAQLDCSYRVDFICCADVLVELKALEKLTTKEHAQLLNYLKVSKYKIGLLINFGTGSLQVKRMIHTEKSV